MIQSRSEPSWCCVCILTNFGINLQWFGLLQSCSNSRQSSRAVALIVFTVSVIESHGYSPAPPALLILLLGPVTPPPSPQLITLISTLTRPTLAQTVLGDLNAANNCLHRELQSTEERSAMLPLSLSWAPVLRPLVAGRAAGLSHRHSHGISRAEAGTDDKSSPDQLQVIIVDIRERRSWPDDGYHQPRQYNTSQSDCRTTN